MKKYKVGTTINSLVERVIFSLSPSLSIPFSDIEKEMEKINKEVEKFDWIETNTGVTFYKKGE